jgi:3-methyladenine DNA glycosylase AlkD
MKEQEVIELLNELKPEVKSGFNPIIPNSKKIRGIAVPKLRKVAQEIARNGYEEFLESNPNSDFEMEMIHSLVIGYAKDDIEKAVGHLKQWAEELHDWAVCDAMCQNFKTARKNREYVWQEVIEPFGKSKKEFKQRVASVLILSHYLTDESIDKDLKLLDEIKCNGYYAETSVAWAIATAFAKQRDKTMEYMRHCKLEKTTYNKAIQKMIESLRVKEEDKEILRKMKK